MRLKMKGIHLDKGKTNNSKSCPIALLLKDSLKDSETEAILLGDGNEYAGWLDGNDALLVDFGHSEGVREFIRKFDAKKPVVDRPLVEPVIEIVPMISTSKRRLDKEGKETQMVDHATHKRAEFIEDFNGEDDIEYTSVLLPAPHPCRQLVLESEVEDYEERGYKKMI